MNFYQVKEYLSYLFNGKYWRGFGIHSPFVFDLIANLARETHPYYAFEAISAWRTALEKSKVKIEVTDLGAGSHHTKKSRRSIGSIARNTAIPPKFGEFIFRLVARNRPANILEIGTSLGISTSYLSLANTSATVTTLEGCPQTAAMAQHTFESLNLKNVSLVEGPFDTTLADVVQQMPSADLVLFDGNHRKKPTLDYFQICLTKVTNHSIFIFDDIHWSKEMTEAWTEIINHPEVTVSVDLFRIGLVFFKKECKKQHFTVRF